MVENPGLPEAPSSSTVVEQPVPAPPASVSLEIAEKLNQTKVEEVEEVVEEQSDEEVVDLDHDSNQSIHLSGENIALDDDCDGENEEEMPEEEEETGEEEVMHGVVLGGKGELDTAAKITSLLSELTSQCDSTEIIQSR